MSVTGRLELLAGGFRRAVSQGSFDESQRLLNEYSSELKRALELQKAGAGEIKTALEMFEWARRATLAARSHAALQLSETISAARYFATAAPARTTWELRG